MLDFLLLAEEAEDGAGFGLPEIMILLVVALVVGACLFFLFKHVKSLKEAKKGYSHELLFDELCEAHDLSSAEITIMRKLAIFHKLEYDGLMFIEPCWLDVYRLPTGLKPKADVVKEIKRKLFS